MSITYPKYYEEFVCKASSCTDNCCIGWEINIDPKTAESYRHITGKLGEKLQKSVITKNGQSCFQRKQERCAFLNEQNLCEIILTLGENSLCEICQEHPRFHNEYGTIRESGLGLCCEEAARLHFASPEPIAFITKAEEAPFPPSKDSDLFWTDAVRTARETAFSLLQNRDYSIAERLALLLAYGEDLQDLCDFGASWEQIRETAKDYLAPKFLAELLSQLKVPPEEKTEPALWWQDALKLYQSLEQIDEHWTLAIKALSDHLSEILAVKKEFETFYRPRSYEYEHLCVYFLFRYWMDCLSDGQILSRVKFTVVSCLFLNLWDCSRFQAKRLFTKQDRIDSAKNYSKEVEYDPQNMELLLKSFEAEPLFSVSELFSLLLDH